MQVWFLTDAAIRSRLRERTTKRRSWSRTMKARLFLLTGYMKLLSAKRHLQKPKNDWKRMSRTGRPGATARRFIHWPALSNALTAERTSSVIRLRREKRRTEKKAIIRDIFPTAAFPAETGTGSPVPLPTSITAVRSWKPRCVRSYPPWWQYRSLWRIFHRRSISRRMWNRSGKSRRQSEMRSPSITAIWSRPKSGWRSLMPQTSTTKRR